MALYIVKVNKDFARDSDVCWECSALVELQERITRTTMATILAARTCSSLHVFSTGKRILRPDNDGEQ